MSRFKSKAELLQDINKERLAFDNLIASIPVSKRNIVIVDGMSVNSFIAHRTEWGRMMLMWYAESKAGKTPAVPSEEYNWAQLKGLNAEIFDKYKDTPGPKLSRDFKAVHDKLILLVNDMSEDELFLKEQHTFTGTTDLATYIYSATAAHYRSASRIIKKWWKGQQDS